MKMAIFSNVWKKTISALVRLYNDRLLLSASRGMYVATITGSSASQLRHPSMNIGNPFMPEQLLKITGPHRMAALLACGHYCTPRHEDSSSWDHPEEALPCPECKEIRQFDVRVQAKLYQLQEA